MQLVDLVQRELVDVALDLLDGEEVPRDVEHRAAVGVARRVGDGAAGDLPRPRLLLTGLDLGGQELTERLGAVEEPRPGGGGYDDGPRGDLEPVALRPQLLVGGLAGLPVLEPQLDAVPAGLGGDRQPVAGGRPQQRGQLTADPPCRVRATGHPDHGLACRWCTENRLPVRTRAPGSPDPAAWARAGPSAAAVKRPGSAVVRSAAQSEQRPDASHERSSWWASFMGGARRGGCMARDRCVVRCGAARPNLHTRIAPRGDGSRCRPLLGIRRPAAEAMSHQGFTVRDTGRHVPDIGQNSCVPFAEPPISTGARSPNGAHDDLIDHLVRTHAAPARRGGPGGAGRAGVLRRDDRGVRPPPPPRAPVRGLANAEIFERIAAELPHRAVAPPELSLRQLRRIVYG